MLSIYQGKAKGLYRKGKHVKRKRKRCTKENEDESE